MSKNWKSNFVRSNNLTNSSSNNVFSGTYTAGLAGVPGYDYTQFTYQSPADLVDECLQSITQGLFNVFTPITASDILVKSAYPKMNMFVRKHKETDPKCGSEGVYDLVIDVAMPYVTEDILDIEANDETNILTITAKNVQEPEDVTYLMRDIPRGTIRQEIQLPKEHYSVKNVKADLHNGVLRLTLVRKTPLESKPTTRKIKIG